MKIPLQDYTFFSLYSDWSFCKKKQHGIFAKIYIYHENSEYINTLIGFRNKLIKQGKAADGALLKRKK